MRSLLLVCLAAAAASASPPDFERAPREMPFPHRPPKPIPTASNTCAAEQAWSKLRTCFEKFGTTTIEREIKGARLLVHHDKRMGSETRFLVVAHGDNWQLAGQFNVEEDLRDFERVTLFGHTGVKLTQRSSAPTSLLLDGNVPTPAFIAVTTTTYCSGVTPDCTVAMTTCDVFVRGKVVRTFHGTVKATKSKLLLTGDRSKSGAECTSPEEIALDWPGQGDWPARE